MKKIMTLVLGLSFLAGTVGVAFAQEPPKQEKKAPKKSNRYPRVAGISSGKAGARRFRRVRTTRNKGGF